MTAHTPHPDRLVERYEPRALVGWTHRSLTTGIELRMQSARSKVGLDNERIEACHFVMTDNQALLLARYLLQITGQQAALPPPRAGLLQRLFGRR